MDDESHLIHSYNILSQQFQPGMNTPSKEEIARADERRHFISHLVVLVSVHNSCEEGGENLLMIFADVFGTLPFVETKQ